MAFNPDGSRLASGGEDVRLWDVSSQQLIGDPMTEHSDADSIRNDFPPSIVVAFSPDGAQIRFLLSHAGRFVCGVRYGMRTRRARSPRPTSSAVNGSRPAPPIGRRNASTRTNRGGSALSGTTWAHTLGRQKDAKQLPPSHQFAPTPTTSATVDTSIRWAVCRG